MAYTEEQQMVGRRIAGQRHKMGISQHALGHEIGLGRNAIMLIEKGIRGIDIFEFVAISRTLKTSQKYLLTGSWE